MKKLSKIKKEIVLSLIIFFLLTVFPVRSNAQLSLKKETANEVFIYLDSTLQVIRGFGAANILPGRPDMTTDEVYKAFGTGPGQLGFTILRLRIPYTDSESDFSVNVPTAKLVESMGAIVFASPWTPPPAMKSNGSIIGGTLNSGSYAAYAAHLKSFADYMAANGAPLYAVSIQNEPDVTVNYESCSWSPSQLVNFCKNNAASVGTRIMMPEAAHFNHYISDPVLIDSVASANVSIIAGHIYGTKPTSYPLAVEKGKEVWMTEYLINSGAPPSNLGIDTGWTGAMQTALSINDCMSAGMSAYVWWYIVRYYGPISDGTYTAKGDITKKGYVMSQFARFIRPEFHRVVATENPQAGVYVTAYKKGTQVVIVAINNSSSSVAQTFTIPDGLSANFTPYVTSATQNCNEGSYITTSNNSFTATLDASSITTFVSDGSPDVVEVFAVPQHFELFQNYPNPFNPSTTLSFVIGHSLFVTLKVYDILGREVATLINEEKPARNYKVEFNAANLPSGIYFYKLKADNLTESKKMILLK